MKYLLVILLVLCSCRCNNKEVSSISDLRDNVYESLVLSFPDASDDELLELYTLHSYQLDHLQDDEVIIIK